MRWSRGPPHLEAANVLSSIALDTQDAGGADFPQQECAHARQLGEPVLALTARTSWSCQPLGGRPPVRTKSPRRIIMRPEEYLMSSIATIDPKLLKLLNPEEAVDLFRDLLWAESWRQGISVLQVSVPSNITAADGGIDAEVIFAPVTTGLLSRGRTCYQIKTGQDFQCQSLFRGPWQPAAAELWRRTVSSSRVAGALAVSTAMSWVLAFARSRKTNRLGFIP